MRLKYQCIISTKCYIDDFFQLYFGNADGGSVKTSLSNKPSNAKTKTQVIAKYGPIETWDTSQVTNMKYVFAYKKNINPDIRKWQVDNVVNMHSMFRETDSFNINLSGWIVFSVTDMNWMFNKATAYTQTLCGDTWVESQALQQSMFTALPKANRLPTS